MRAFQLIFAIVFFIGIGSVFAQKRLRILKHENYTNYFRAITIKMDTVELEEEQKIDLTLYRNKFSKPYFFPLNFLDKKFKNETIVVWENDKGAKDFKQNWTYTYTYDSLSRVITYEYSSCYVCSQLPWSINIKYDKENRPIEIVESNKFIKNTDKDKPLYNGFKIGYNNKNEIDIISFYIAGKLTDKIELLN